MLLNFLSLEIASASLHNLVVLSPAEQFEEDQNDTERIQNHEQVSQVHDAAGILLSFLAVLGELEGSSTINHRHGIGLLGVRQLWWSHNVARVLLGVTAGAGGHV